MCCLWTITTTDDDKSTNRETAAYTRTKNSVSKFSTKVLSSEIFIQLHIPFYCNCHLFTMKTFTKCKQGILF